MSTEQEFTQWLKRPDKTFEENLLFAKNAWQSLEFTYPNKYESVFNWLSSVLPAQTADSTFPALTFREVLNLRVQPGLVSTDTKKKFVNSFLALCERSTGTDARVFAELLSCLLTNEALQDLYRAEYTLLAHIYGVLFVSYSKYLKEPGSVPSPAMETEFFLSVVQSLKDYIKRTHDLSKFEVSYREQLLPHLTILMRSLADFSLDFLDELVTLEQLLTVSMENETLIARLQELDVDTRIYTLACALQFRRTDNQFLIEVLKIGIPKSVNNEDNPPENVLKMATHTLKMFTKNNIDLNFKYKEKTAQYFIVKRLMKLVAKYKDVALGEVLTMLCAALRLNPLLLEDNVFQLTIWMLVAPKTTYETQTLYAEFIVLLLDMFRRLSRAERFITSFLRALKEWLSSYELPPVNSTKKKRELNSTPHQTRAIKRQKTDADNELDFIEILANENLGVNTNSETLTFETSFPELQTFWPSESIGNAFSKLVANLVSKPSMVVWKSILYSFKEQLELNTKNLDNNTLFLIDLHAALLCQYFHGTRLADQAHKFCDELNAMRSFNREILSMFGRFVLAREHNKRIMQGFLECSYYATGFDMLLGYYAPDGLDADHVLGANAIATQIHGYLTDAEWELIEQRVLNFGKRNCKKLFERVQTQRTDALHLLSSHQCDDGNKSNEANVDVVTKTLAYKFEVKLSETKLNALEAFTPLYEELKQLHVQGSVSLSLHERSQHEDTAKKQLQAMANVLNEQHAEAEVADLRSTLPLKMCSDVAMTLHMLSVAYLRSGDKCEIFLRLLALYRDVVATESVETIKIVFAVLIKFLERGDPVPIFKYFNATQLMKLLPVRISLPFYKLIFQNYIRQQVKGTTDYLSDLSNILKTEMATNGQLMFDDQVELLLLAIETLTNTTGPSAKLMHKYLNEFLTIYASFVRMRFTKTTTAAEDAEFVKRTLSGYAHYVKVFVSKAEAKIKEQPASTSWLEPEIDEDFRRISKIYIGHSLNYRSMDSLRLMNTALNYRQSLHLDQDEIELVLSGYWRQLKEDLKSNAILLSNCIEYAVKLIINNKTNEYLLLTLRQLDDTVQLPLTETSELRNVLALLELIAKCPFSAIKGAIFNEQFRLITTHIALRLFPKEQQQQYDASFCDHALLLLGCQRTVVENRTVPLSSDTLDSIINLLLYINIKKFTLADASLAHFVKLHTSMTELCITLLRQRTLLLMDRVPQLLQIFNDLLQAIIWYKCNRQNDAVITENELKDLEELTVKLSTLVGLMKTHSVAIKRLAPFVLIQTIQLMVANKRPTTLYPQIKIHIESICHVLIGICDHRSGHFILRNCNDAGRQLYERLHKDYLKYQKFKGKV